MHDLRDVGSLRHQVNNDLMARTDNTLSTDCHELTLLKIVNWDDGLSEEEAAALSLWNNPTYQTLLTDLQIARADIIEAAQVQNPQASTMIPAGPKQWEFTLNVPIDVLWLRPIRVAAAQLESHRIAQRLVQDGLNVTRDARVAYVNWRLAEERTAIVEEILKLRLEVSRVAEARLQAGESAELDVAAVRLDASVGQAELQRAIRDRELARERLRYLLGLQKVETNFFAESRASIETVEVDLLDVNQLVAEAVASRPDIRALTLAFKAASQRAEFAERDIWRLSAFLPDINSRGVKGFEAGPGFQFNLPIFNQNQGARARACADAQRVGRQLTDQQDLASMEVRQAFVQLTQARQEWQLWQDQIVPQATAAAEAAQHALKEDAVSLLLVLETTRQLMGARQNELESAAQFRRAIAELERSVGRRLSNYTSDGLIEQDWSANSDS